MSVMHRISIQTMPHFLAFAQLYAPVRSPHCGASLLGNDAATPLASDPETWHLFPCYPNLSVTQGPSKLRGQYPSYNWV